MRSVKWVVILAIWLSMTCVRASATVLLFRPATGDFSDFGALPQGYGNRVVSDVQDGFLYGLDGGPTPNVVVLHSTGDLPPLYTWRSDYGDLQNVVFAQEPMVFKLALVADDGFTVTLNSFDMAAWPHLDITINSVTVYDQDGNPLYSATDVPIYGAPDGPQHTHFDFSDGSVTGKVLYIAFDSTNYDSDDIGIANINFSQS